MLPDGGLFVLAQDMLEMSTEQRRNFVAVNKTFQARRKVLLDQRQSIYGLMQRPKTRYNNAEDIIVEFLKVPIALHFDCETGCVMPGGPVCHALCAVLVRGEESIACSKFHWQAGP